MSGITYSEIGDEVLGEAMELMKPAVGETKLNSCTIEGELVKTKAPVGLTSFLTISQAGRREEGM